jgi:Zn-finger nucleic acid-binding protein
MTNPPAHAPSTPPDCVECHAPLERRTHETIDVLACPAGHGLLVRSDALQEALHDRSEDRAEHEEQDAEASQGPVALATVHRDERVRACPMCGGDMAKRVFAYESGVPIDVCADHGVWLDHGELQRIEAWYEAQERHHAADTATWGGSNGRLEQIEQTYEQQRAEDLKVVHWAPIGAFLAKLSYLRDRLDDE